ncbi:MAG: hypothetical protein ACK5LN_11485 [Propioniciclava sp.]
MTAVVDPQVVWERWTNIEKWPADTPTIVRAQLNGPVAQGAVGWMKPRRGPRASFRIVEVNRMAGHFEIEAKLLLGRITIERFLNRSESGPDGAWMLTHRVVFSGPMARIWNRVIGRNLTRIVPEVLARIAAIAAI